MKPLLSRYLQEKRVQTVSPYINGTILDIGCGFSIVPLKIKSAQSYTGIDKNKKALARCMKKFERCNFIVQDFESDDINLGYKFDTILMLAVFEHLHNPISALNQITRHLAPKGKLIITTPTPIGGIIHTIGSFGGLFSRKAVFEHEKLYNRKNLTNILETQGYKIEHYSRFAFLLNQLFIAKLS